MAIADQQRADEVGDIARALEIFRRTGSEFEALQRELRRREAAAAEERAAWLEQQREATIPKLVTRVQAHFRGWRQRKVFRKMLAVHRIVSFWRRSKVRACLSKLNAAFAGVATRPDLGKNQAWPAIVPGTQQFILHCKKIHLCWRARTILARYKNPQVKEELVRKALALDMLQGRRKFFLAVGLRCNKNGEVAHGDVSPNSFGSRNMNSCAQFWR